jgi:hypothetical protein
MRTKAGDIRRRMSFRSSHDSKIPLSTQIQSFMYNRIAKRKDVTPMTEPTEDPKQREMPPSGRESSRPASPEETEQLVLTIGATTGDILKVEKVDKTGTRHELSEDECAKLAGEDEVEEIEAALEEAFEAGVVGALGEDDEEEEDEDDEEGARRRLLIGELLGRPLVRRRLRRRLLRRLLLRRLLRRRLLRRAYRDI